MAILYEKIPEINMLTCHVDKHTKIICRNTFELTKFMNTLTCDEFLFYLSSLRLTEDVQLGVVSVNTLYMVNQAIN